MRSFLANQLHIVKRHASKPALGYVLVLLGISAALFAGAPGDGLGLGCDLSKAKIFSSPTSCSPPSMIPPFQV